jgi:NitT/TauT family transport system substrate-binding protein
MVGRKRMMALVALATASLMVAACGNKTDNSTPGNGEKVPLTFAYPSDIPSVDQAPYSSLPRELGYWDSLDVKDLLLNGVEAINAVALGRADVASAPSANVIDAVGSGANVVSIFAIYPNSFSYPAVPEDSPIKSAKDLTGKTVGVISLQATSAIALTKASISSAGGDPSKTQFVAVGKGTTALAALKAGRVDALGEYTAAYAEIKSLGTPMRSLQAPELSQLGFSYLIVTRPDVIEKKRDALVKLIQGVAKSDVFIKVNPQAATQLHYKHFPQMKPTDVSEDVAIQRGVDVLNAAVKDATPVKENMWGYDTADRIKFTVDLYAKVGAVKQTAPVDKLWTDSLVIDANKFDQAAQEQAAKSYKFSG